MTAHPIPHRLIIQSFFWPHTAEDISWFLTKLYGTKITATKIKDMWIEESALNPLLQVDRPANGLPQTDETRLMERLAA